MNTKPSHLEMVDRRYLQKAPATLKTPPRYYQNCEFVDLCRMTDPAEVRAAVDVMLLLKKLLVPACRPHLRIESMLFSGQLVLHRNLGLAGSCVILTQDTLKPDQMIDPDDGSSPQALGPLVSEVVRNLKNGLLFTRIETDGSPNVDTLLRTIGDDPSNVGPIVHIGNPHVREIEQAIRTLLSEPTV